MDIDGSSIPPGPGAGDIDQNLLLQFSCMNTTDREELIRQMQKLLGSSLNYNTASFFLDMSNWNLQAAICSYLDYSIPPKPPSMALQKCDNNVTVVTPGTCFEWSCTLINTGVETWPGSCRIVQTGGEDMGGTPIFVPPLPAGHSTTVYMKLTAPKSIGIHRAYFNLLTDRDDKFGDTIWVEINVESDVTMGLVEQLALLPVPSTLVPESEQPSCSHSSPPDDQMC